jgi:hypothetical protein
MDSRANQRAERHRCADEAGQDNRELNRYRAARVKRQSANEASGTPETSHAANQRLDQPQVLIDLTTPLIFVDFVTTLLGATHFGAGLGLLTTQVETVCATPFFRTGRPFNTTGFVASLKPTLHRRGFFGDGAFLQTLTVFAPTVLGVSV